MADLEPERRRAHFGVFTACLETGQLHMRGMHVRIQELPFRFLATLLRRPGALVTREELRRELWSIDTFVDFDRGINTAVTKLRQALGDSAENPRFIETVGRRGYRFIAPVQLEGEAVDPEALPPPAPGPVPIESVGQTREATPLSDRRLHGMRLRWVVFAVVVLLLAAGGSTLYRMRSSSVPVVSSLVVLPLENVSGDPSQDAFGDGITDELITALAKVPNMTVISRTSAMHFKNSNLSLPEIAKQLGVHAVLEGTVKRSGNRVRITAQLIDAATDHHLWADVYESDMADVLHVQEQIAQKIAAAAAGELSAREKAVKVGYRPVNPESFDVYLEGRIHWARRSPDSIPLAVKEFERAIALDPNFAPAYSGLADALLVLPVVSTQGDTALYERARTAARRAIELDPSSAEAHTSLASADEAEWKFAEAESEFRRAIQLNPNYSTAHQWFAEDLSIVGKHDEAIAEIQRAIALDPLSAIVQHQAGQVYQEARQYDKAI